MWSQENCNTYNLPIRLLFLRWVWLSLDTIQFFFRSYSFSRCCHCMYNNHYKKSFFNVLFSKIRGVFKTLVFITPFILFATWKSLGVSQSSYAPKPTHVGFENASCWFRSNALTQRVKARYSEDLWHTRRQNTSRTK